MGKYIKYYKKDAQYQEEKDNLILPNVSYTEDDNMVYYNPDNTSEEDKYEFVDMGLSVDWATCNIGATKPEEAGWYFQWAGTTAYNSDRTPVEGGDAINFDWSNYPLCNGSENTLTKYGDDSSYGIVDNKTILDPEDDAAHVHMGGDWRMPTIEEFQELIDTCDYGWTSTYDNRTAYGWKFTLKSDPSKTLFFPNPGYIYGQTIWAGGGQGGPESRYWSKSIRDDDPTWGRALRLQLGVYASWLQRYYGCNIRAVRPKQSSGGVDEKWETIYDYTGDVTQISSNGIGVRAKLTLSEGDKIQLYCDDKLILEDTVKVVANPKVTVGEKTYSVVGDLLYVNTYVINKGFAFSDVGLCQDTDNYDYFESDEYLETVNDYWNVIVNRMGSEDYEEFLNNQPHKIEIKKLIK